MFFQKNAHTNIEVNSMENKIVLIDFGDPDVAMLAGICMELGVKVEVLRADVVAKSLKKIENLKGIILSGSPADILKNPIFFDVDILRLGIPVLGVCYGMELIIKSYGGKLEHREKEEKGEFQLTITKESVLFENIASLTKVHMSHREEDTVLPKGFEKLAHTSTCLIAATENIAKNLYGVQFHPEKQSTSCGRQLLKNFLFKICGCE